MARRAKSTQQQRRRRARFEPRDRMLTCLRRDARHGRQVVCEGANEIHLLLDAMEALKLTKAIAP